MSDEQKQDAPEVSEEKVQDAPAAAPEAATTEATEEAAEPATEAPAEETNEEPATEEAAEEVEEVVEELPYQNIRPGMVVRVHERILDVSPKGEPRERIQLFEGIVIGMKGGGISRTMTVRKDSKGWMVEKIYPLSSPNVTKVEVVKQYRVRRAKLNYLKKRFKRKLREIKKA
jgi:large subunit ribosomal protein L19